MSMTSTNAAEPSLAQLTFLPGESPVNRSQSPASKPVNEILVTSGLSSFDWFKPFGPASSWLRMLVASSAWHSTRVGLTWRVKATPAGRLYCQLAVSMRPTDATASGSLALWPTPTVDDSSNVTRESGEFQSLVRSVMWPTPRAEAPDTLSVAPSYTEGRHGWSLGPAVGSGLWPTPRHEGFDAGAHRGNPDSLHSAVKQNPMRLLPTPMAQAAKHGEPTDYEYEHRPNDLHVVAALLPTPTVGDSRNRPRGEMQAEFQSLIKTVFQEEGLLPTPDSVNRKSAKALHGTGPRSGRSTEALHASGPGLEQAVELMSGILPKEYDDESQLSPAARRLLPIPQAMEASSDLEFQVSGDGRETPNKLRWAVASQMYPTPTVIDATMTAVAKRGQKGRHAVQLSHLANSGRLESDDWAREPVPELIGTPTAAMKRRSTEHAQGRALNPQEIADQMLPTPKERDFRSAEGQAGLKRDSPDLNVMIANGTGMKLNPDWVARMQGFPDGWLLTGMPPLPEPRITVVPHQISWFANDGEWFVTRHGVTPNPNAPLRRGLRKPRWMHGGGATR